MATPSAPQPPASGARPPRWPSVVVAVSGVIFLISAVMYLRGPNQARNDVPPADSAPLVLEFLRDPVEVEPFTVTDLDGQTFHSADWRGKVVLVNFWATWCMPCIVEIPDLIALQKQYPDQVVVVGISEDQVPVPVVREFVASRGVNYPIVMTTLELHQRFPGVQALPTTFVLDPKGRLVKKHEGLLTGREAEALTRALSGMRVDATIREVDDPGRLSAHEAASITDVPGVDLASVPSERRGELLQVLNTEDCACGCGMSIARCRVDDPSCEVSLPLAREIAAKFAAGVS
jgi:thiol-disulfide isomerase/thioredoxin